MLARLRIRIPFLTLTFRCQVHSLKLAQLHGTVLVLCHGERYGPPCVVHVCRISAQVAALAAIGSSVARVGSDMFVDGLSPLNSDPKVWPRFHQDLVEVLHEFCWDLVRIPSRSHLESTISCVTRRSREDLDRMPPRSQHRNISRISSGFRQDLVQISSESLQGLFQVRITSGSHRHLLQCQDHVRIRIPRNVVRVPFGFRLHLDAIASTLGFSIAYMNSQSRGTAGFGTSQAARLFWVSCIGRALLHGGRCA